jgi:hypothetical protein
MGIGPKARFAAPQVDEFSLSTGSEVGTVETFHLGGDHEAAFDPEEAAPVGPSNSAIR